MKSKKKKQATKLTSPPPRNSDFAEFVADLNTPNGAEIRDVDKEKSIDGNPAAIPIPSSPRIDSFLVEENLSNSDIPTPLATAQKVLDGLSKTRINGAQQVFDNMPKRVATPEIKNTWSDLFKDNRNITKGMKLEYFSPENDKFVLMEDDDDSPLHENWEFCLVGCFTGRFPGLKALNAIKDGWGVKCNLLPHAKGWNIFKFESEEDRSKVLTGGPYMVYGKTLMLKNLSANFRFDCDEFLDAPIWVKFHGVPLKYWNPKALSKIASKLGKPLYTDQVTNERTRISYARILVEVDLRVKPWQVFEVKSKSGFSYMQHVEYEHFPDFCYHCHKFGHNFETCQVLSKIADKKVETSIHTHEHEQDLQANLVLLEKTVATYIDTNVGPPSLGEQEQAGVECMKKSDKFLEHATGPSSAENVALKQGDIKADVTKQGFDQPNAEGSGSWKLVKGNEERRNRGRDVEKEMQKGAPLPEAKVASQNAFAALSDRDDSAEELGIGENSDGETTNEETNGGDANSTDDEDEEDDPDVAAISELTFEFVTAVRNRKGKSPMTREEFERHLAQLLETGAEFVKVN